MTNPKHTPEIIERGRRITAFSTRWGKRNQYRWRTMAQVLARDAFMKGRLDDVERYLGECFSAGELGAVDWPTSPALALALESHSLRYLNEFAARQFRLGRSKLLKRLLKEHQARLAQSAQSTTEV